MNQHFHRHSRRAIPGVMAAVMVAMITVVFAASLWAKEFKLTAGSSHPPIIPWVGAIKNHVVPESNRKLKAMGSPHSIKWTEAYAGALYNFNNTLEGVQDGLADIGWVGTLWEPSKLPLQNVTFLAPFATMSVQYTAEIQDELHRNVPAMNQQWKKYNQVYLGAQTIDGYVLISKTPIRSVDDLRGKKLYTPGPIALWLQGTGAIAVNGGLPVYYNGIKTGIADAAILPGSAILPFKLHEVAPYITDPGLGSQITGALTMNLDTWNSLPSDMQQVFRELGREYGKLVIERVTKNRIKHFKILASKGAIISTLSRAEQRRWANMLPNIAKDWVRRVESRGLPAKLVLKAYMDGLRNRGEKPLRDWDKDL